MKEEKRKKGETLHHISYLPPFVIKVSRGEHLVLTAYQSMNPTKENIERIEKFLWAVQFILWQKKNKLKI